MVLAFFVYNIMYGQESDLYLIKKDVSLIVRNFVRIFKSIKNGWKK